MTQLRPGTPEEAGLDRARIAHADELCRSWVEQGVHKALCVLVARRGVTALHEAYGAHGPHGAPPLRTDAIFPMASLSKVVTATALMTLVDDGLVGLTRPVEEYIPEFTGDGRETVCVHHLLTHTSGLREEALIAPIAPSPAGERLAAETGMHPAVAHRLVHTLEAALSTKPGDEMFYCNHNYRLIAEIVRRATGCPVEDIAASSIFEPLGMHDTSYVLPDEHFSRTIDWSMYPPAYDTFTTTRDYRRTPAPEGGVYSTTTDMATFAQMFLDGGDGVLGRATVSEMMRDQVPGVRATFGPWQEKEASWSYGWGVAGNEKWERYPVFPAGTIHHGGAGLMFVWADPLHEIVGAYFSICRRFQGTVELPEPVTNVDLFVNAVYAAVE